MDLPQGWMVWSLFALILIYYVHVAIRRHFQWMKLPPGPFGLPIIGNFIDTNLPYICMYILECWVQLYIHFHDIPLY